MVLVAAGAARWLCSMAQWSSLAAVSHGMSGSVSLCRLCVRSPWLRDDVVRMLVDTDYAMTEDTASYTMRTGAWWGMETFGTAWEGAHQCRLKVAEAVL